ncbi:protein LEAD-SENSITIVE 1-like isoform X1 [Ziziphus jujuba]|uniref:Protein LEAD-SENSITIVE 1-like isoform X1 n=1 Tax=Ziziphus jujuba TaxID=326968 RepID=A0ABM4A6V7_ZIZJJ|nr:protein LEAD-SENSITIVE 1-like isoform X1 [Ziziphus jujuba]XP_060672461.1 protein LEAD-SENSITIVE 1-like isoform X1 [Ziziphus jujuba]XP_060672462.1 protein LEAD-SENSITIVE 1-like isoform X1 [Ziziphus jujuba]XP_060672463.1 protein LEAD-SENSITIVE 1-like isoform X1 [Ziziphus jujuba]XP_060672464.1 protein LEAD-SENSITIVE 1-like isoform X1 [Ziziphus jujuba]XP_060672465.1 protein LEAD-SENSITIVE 1-like isoform X1 [Ziziphus jujuba]
MRINTIHGILFACLYETPRIYIFDEKVIHFDCHGVVFSSIEDFLSCGDVDLFEYGVNPALFLTKFREHTSTLASADPPQVVQDCTAFLLNYGASSDYYHFINNDEDFAMYCKTGLLVVDSIVFSRSWQTAFFLAVTTAVFLSLLQLAPATLTGLAARCLSVYYVSRLVSDIGARPNVIKIEAERLPVVDEILASGGLGRIEFLIDLFLRILMCAFAFFCLLLSLWSQTLPVLWTLACFILFYWAVFGKRLLSNKIQKKQMKPKDHIFVWRRN